MENNHNPYNCLTQKSLYLLQLWTDEEIHDSVLTYKSIKTNIENPFNTICYKVLEYLPINIKSKIINDYYAINLSEDIDNFEPEWDTYYEEDIFRIRYHYSFAKINKIYFFIALDYNYLKFGVYLKNISEDGSSLLIKNCRKYYEDLLTISNHVSHFSQKFYIMIGNEILDNEISNCIELFNEFVQYDDDFDYYGIHLESSISSQKLIKVSLFEQAIKDIAKSFEGLFPLVLLAISDDPISEIYKYLNVSSYFIDLFSRQLYLEKTILNHYIKTLKRKKQIIFQGSPGTGKTYLAKHIAKHLTSSGDGFFELIQFHPTYSYEDFIQGIRPQTSPDGNLEYSLIPGRFLDFCKKAETCQDICILIIDEINRTNLSQVFGELMYLLEYREEEIKLAGSNQPFKIPENVYIIGTMNTADRSIALVDHALRRRFAFITIKPNYEILRKYNEKHNPNFPTDNLINILANLNQIINDPHYEIGVSFFLTQTLEADIQDIWTMEIEPYLEEYFFDETDKIDQFSWDKIKSKLGFNYDNQ